MDDVEDAMTAIVGRTPQTNWRLTAQFRRHTPLPILVLPVALYGAGTVVCALAFRAQHDVRWLIWASWSAGTWTALRRTQRDNRTEYSAP